VQAFLGTRRARSINAKHTAAFQEHIRAAYRHYCAAGEHVDHSRYGSVYYFHQRHNQLDADNLSKPVADARNGLAYVDDQIMRLRHAGVIDLISPDMTSFDLSDMPDNVAEDFINFIGSTEHVLYIEFGQLPQHMFVFGQAVHCEV
jgi:hypothetical protein